MASTIQCPKCETENRSEAQYCLGCGKSLGAGTAAPEHSSVGSGPTAPSEAASEAGSIGSVGTDHADELSSTRHRDRTNHPSHIPIRLPT